MPDDEMTDAQRAYLTHQAARAEPKETEPKPEAEPKSINAGDAPTKIRIEPNVPIPAPRNGSRGGRWRRVSDTMKDGDSVGSLTHKEAGALIKAIKASGRAAVVRKSEEGVCRVWVNSTPGAVEATGG